MAVDNTGDAVNPAVMEIGQVWDGEILRDHRGFSFLNLTPNKEEYLGAEYGLWPGRECCVVQYPFWEDVTVGEEDEVICKNMRLTLRWFNSPEDIGSRWSAITGVAVH